MEDDFENSRTEGISYPRRPRELDICQALHRQRPSGVGKSSIGRHGTVVIRALESFTDFLVGQDPFRIDSYGTPVLDNERFMHFVDAIAPAFTAGAPGVILSRKYSGPTWRLRAVRCAT